MRTHTPVLLLLIATIAACGEEAADCDAAALQGSLDAAAAGSTVTAGACIFRGPLTIPAGVTLTGAGREATIVTAPEGGSALTLVPGSTATAATDLSIESNGCAGVVARGAGEATLERVIVSASSGIGIGVEGLDRLILHAVDVVGPITRDTADATTPPLPPFTCDSSALATHGLVLVDVGEAILDNVETNGFAAFGALLIRSGTTWRAGGAADNLGTGLEVWGGGAGLESLTLLRARDGLGAIESFNGVFASGAEVRTISLLVADGSSYGLMHDAATGRHSGLTVRDNGFAGVWSQGAPALQLTGSDLLNNGFAGVAAIDGTDVELDGVRVEGTVERLSIGGARTIRAADGVQLVRSAGMVSDLVLASNERVGLLLELGGGSTSSVSLAGVMVDGTGSAYGAVAQNGTLEPAWDSGVTRAGDTVANDAAFAVALDVAGAVGPPCLPPLADVETAGLDVLLGP